MKADLTESGTDSFAATNLLLPFLICFCRSQFVFAVMLFAFAAILFAFVVTVVGHRRIGLLSGRLIGPEKLTKNDAMRDFNYQ